MYLKVLLVVTLFTTNYLYADNYMKAKIKNREYLQKKHGHFNRDVYNYEDKREISDAQRNINRNIRKKRTNTANIGVVDITRNSRVKNVYNYVDAKQGINIKGKKINANIGVVNIDKKSNVNNVYNNLETKRDITIGR